MSNKINPVGLKGQEVTERMKQLMGVTSINENKKASAVELTKVGPDGNVYAIIRENHEYYIKTTSKKEKLTLEDFQYIGGLQNKKQEAYPTYAKAIKQLNLKFNSLNEVYGKSGQVNVFKDDNLLTEGFYNAGMAEYDKPAMASFKKQYGDEEGKSIYYATANKQDRDPETFEKNEELSDNSKNLPVEKKPSFMSKIKDKLDRSFKSYASDLEKRNDFSGDRLKGIPSDLDFQSTMGYDALHGVGMLEIEMSEDEMAIDDMIGEYSEKQEKIAGLAGDPDKIDAADLAALRAGKKSDEGYMDEIEMSEYEMAIDEMIEESKEEMSDKEKKFAALAEPKDKITYADKIAGAKKDDKESDDENQNESIVDEMAALLEASEALLKKKL
jgi:hypothetical protein